MSDAEIGAFLTEYIVGYNFVFIQYLYLHIPFYVIKETITCLNIA